MVRLLVKQFAASTALLSAEDITGKEMKKVGFNRRRAAYSYQALHLEFGIRQSESGLVLGRIKILNSPS